MEFKKNPDKQIVNLLKKRGVDVGDAVAFAVADMDTENNYAESWLILTKLNFVFVRLKPHTGIKTFAGYPERPKKDYPEPSGLSVDVYNLEDITACGTDEMVSGGIFYITKKDGTDLLLCSYGGQYGGDMRLFSRIFDKLIKNEELNDKDYTDDHPEMFCEKCGMPFPDRDRRVCPHCMDKRSVFSRVMSFFKPHAFRVFLVAFCFTVLSGLDSLLPYLTGKVYFDDIIGKNSALADKLSFVPGGWVGILIVSVATMFLVNLIDQLLIIVQMTSVAKVVPDVVRRIKDAVFDSLKRLSLNFFTGRQTGTLMTRVLGDASEVSSFFLDGFPYLFGYGIKIIVIAVVMISLNWKLGIMTMLLIPLLVFFSVKLQPRLWHLHGRRHRASRGLNNVLNDSFTGTRVIKAFGQEQSAVNRFNKDNRKVASAEVANVKYGNWYYMLYSGVQNLMVLLVWAVGAYFIVRGDSGVSYGMLATFVTYVALMSGPLDFMSNVFNWWTSSLNASQRIFEIIDAVPDITENKDAVDAGRINGEIEFQNVTFSYDPGHPILKNISVKVGAGEMLGIVGRSGVGKTTMISLISRLYDPDSGKILIDGRDIRDFTLKSLRRNIAVVSQESYIFMGTVAENIAYANPDATREEIVNASIAASAHDFICRMPDGYDTVIGSGGRQLSGGERQRLSVARAILANPRILILDEATASVDTATERSIQKALDSLVKGRTTLSIAHRLSTLNNADLLIVIDEGEIAERGTHAELTEKNGIYRRLADLQQSALLTEGVEEKC